MSGDEFMHETYGECAMCKKDLTQGEYMNSKNDPKVCYPCWLWAVQTASDENGKTGYLSQVKEVIKKELELKKEVL